MGRRKYIERAIKVDSIFDQAKSAARAAGLHNIQGCLLAIAHGHSLEAQLAKVQEIAARRSVPRRKSSKSAERGNVIRNELPIQDAVPNPEPAERPDETLTAEQEVQLAGLRTSWRVDKVLKRDEFENMPSVTQRCFIREELLGIATGEVAATAPVHYETACHGLTTPDEAARAHPQSSQE